MSRILTSQELTEIVSSQSYIKNGDVKSVEGIKYDFRMSSRVLKASQNGREVDLSKLSQSELAEMVVQPGEVVFVLTEEELELPNNVYAELVPKRKLSHQGIIVLGGFSVDPLYEGRLMVGLLNYSSTTFPLEPGRKLIAAIFHELQGNEIGEFESPAAPITEFPNDLKTTISSYQPINVGAIEDQIRYLKEQIQSLRDEVTTDRDWKRNFQQTLEIQSKNIDKLLAGLDEEKENRIASERQINNQISEIKTEQAKFGVNSKNNHALLIAILGLVGAVVIFIIGYFLGSK